MISPGEARRVVKQNKTRRTSAADLCESNRHNFPIKGLSRCSHVCVCVWKLLARRSVPVNSQKSQPDATAVLLVSQMEMHTHTHFYLTHSGRMSTTCVCCNSKLVKICQRNSLCALTLHADAIMCSA